MILFKIIFFAVIVFLIGKMLYNMVKKDKTPVEGGNDVPLDPNDPNGPQEPQL